MILPYQNHNPIIPSSARIAENATVTGEVTLGENVSVWFSAVIRGDSSAISVGDNTNIQDLCCLHSDAGRPLSIGKSCVVGHRALLHGCTVGDNCLIGMGAILLNGCVIGEGSLVGAGALVTENKVFPPNSLLMGTPARVVRTLRPEEVANIIAEAEHYAEKSKVAL